MAKAKLSLAVAATFKAIVSIPVPGGKAADVEFIFKHRTRDDFKEFVESLPGAENADALMDVASGWDLDEPFGKEAVEKLEQRYMGSTRAVLDVYMAELTGARAKN
jgi:hypothetical protein